MVSKTMQLVDNVLYGFTNAFQLFCNNRGVETLVDRIEVGAYAMCEEYSAENFSSMRLTQILWNSGVINLHTRFLFHTVRKDSFTFRKKSDFA